MLSDIESDFVASTSNAVRYLCTVPERMKPAQLWHQRKFVKNVSFVDHQLGAIVLLHCRLLMEPYPYP